MIKAQLLRHSINQWGTTITSWLLEYPRFIHSELMTHRDFSRNAASSRAIPLMTTIQELRRKPALPVWWGSHKKGMGAGEQLTGDDLAQAKHAWIRTLQNSLAEVQVADRHGLHKSLTNRLLEPWVHMKCVVTLTDHRNFFSLRAHKDAQPEFQVLAYRMLEIYLGATPQPVAEGAWHMPFLDELDDMSVQDQLKLATARCCWTSYGKPDRTIGEATTLADAYARHDASIEAGHWSPFEHCAQATDPHRPYIRSNFDTDNMASGWFQYRKLFTGERRTEDVDLEEILRNRPEWTKTAGLE
jgi:hypothetical protein